MYDIVLGRTQGDLKKFGKKGTVLIGKQYVQMGHQSSLSNPIYLDVARAHAMLIVGKRGGGKSYTMGSIAEGLADMDPEISKNLSFVLMDTMGVYWSMKYANEKDDEILKKWGLEGKGLDVQIYVPGGFYDKYRADGIPVDFPFYIQPRELSIEDWMQVFKLNSDNPVGVIIQKIIGDMLNTNDNFSIDDVITKIKNFNQITNDQKLAATMRFENTKNWGIFSNKATKIKDILHPGQVTVMDLSPFVALPGGWEVKALVLGLVSKKIFVERMLVRKNEEKQQISAKTQITVDSEVKDDIPMPWIIVDEAHEFLPRGADDEVPSSKALITILREIGRASCRERVYAPV